MLISNFSLSSRKFDYFIAQFCKNNQILFYFSFLKVVANCNGDQPNMSLETLNKRLIFVKTYIKLLSVYANRNKANISRKEQDISILISRQLTDLEVMVNTEEECTVLLKELLCSLNIEHVKNIVLGCYIKWIENKPGNGLIIRSLLNTLGSAVSDYDILASLMEVTINSYFVNTGKYTLHF